MNGLRAKTNDNCCNAQGIWLSEFNHRYSAKEDKPLTRGWHQTIVLILKSNIDLFCC